MKPIPRQRLDKHVTADTQQYGKTCFLCGPCRGVILKKTGATQAVGCCWHSLTSSKRTETRSTGEYERSACESVKCELNFLFEVCDSVRLNTQKLQKIE
jgi:hypothetical protein